MPTTVKKIYVQQGDWVKPGQMLLRLDDADARLQAAKAEAQLKGAEADLTAVQGGGTQEELLTTRNALVKAQADRDAAERNLAGDAEAAANRSGFAGRSRCRAEPAARR